MLPQNYLYKGKRGMNKCQKRVNFLLFILFWHFAKLFLLNNGLFSLSYYHNDRLFHSYLFPFLVIFIFLQ